MKPAAASQSALPFSGNRLALFAAFWAAGALIELGKWNSWRQEPMGFLTALAAIALLSHPSSIPRLALLCSCQVLSAAAAMPWLTNHTILSASVSLLLLVLLSHSASASRCWPSRSPAPHQVYATLASSLRTTLILVYSVATFHKLNTSWFDPNASCAVLFWNRIGSWTPVPGLFRSTAPIAPWLAIFVEALLPFLLAIPRARPVAVLIGLAFHLILGLVGFFRFSTLVTLLYFPFVPAAVLDESAALFRRWLPQSSVLTRLAQALSSDGFRLGLGALLAALAIPGIVWLARHPLSPQPALVRDAMGGPAGLGGRLAQAVWAVATLALFSLLSVATWRTRAIPVRPTPTGHPVLQWALPAFVLALGLGPYSGIRTQSTFSMFSNLRVTATGSNHLIFRGPALWSPPGSDTVTILDSNDAELLRARTGNHAIPWIELCSYAQHKIRSGSDLSVTYERSGSIFHVKSAASTPDAFPATPALLRQILCFRPVNLDPECRCTH